MHFPSVYRTAELRHSSLCLFYLKNEINDGVVNKIIYPWKRFQWFESRTSSLKSWHAEPLFQIVSHF